MTHEESSFVLPPPSSNRLTIVADLCSAYLSNNSVSIEKVPDFIRAVSDVTKEIADRLDAAPASFTASAKSEPEETPVPAVPVEDSVTDEFITCLEDGKQFKSLKRHLKSRYDMTPEQYRERWGLNADYPMVSKNYSASRSALAKSMGLGQQPIPRKGKEAAGKPSSRKKAA